MKRKISLSEHHFIILSSVFIIRYSSGLVEKTPANGIAWVFRYLNTYFIILSSVFIIRYSSGLVEKTPANGISNNE